MTDQYAIATSDADAATISDPSEVDVNVTVDSGITADQHLASPTLGGNVVTPCFGMAGAHVIVDDQAYTDGGDGDVGSLSSFTPGTGFPNDGFRNEKRVALDMGGFDPLGTAAKGTLTMDTVPADTNTVTIDTKVYKFQTTLTDVDGNIAIGGSLAQAKLNLVAAMTRSGVAGTDYADLMTEHRTVDMADFISDDVILTAKVPGLAGSTIVTTETFTPAGNIFDATTLGATLEGTDVVPRTSLEPVGISADVALVDQNA